MTRFVRPLAGLLALLAVPSHAVAATPACWAAAEIGAARIVELRIMMMTTSLRCRRIGVEIGDSFDAFERVQKAALALADATLQRRFGAVPGRGGGDYDHYMIGLANHYGGGLTSAEVCRKFDTVASVLARAVTGTGLLDEVAFAIVRDPWLDAPRCPAGKVVEGRKTP